MWGFGLSVRLTQIGERDGLVLGEVGRFRWEARLARGPVSYGLNPETLYKGTGRIARLILFEPLPGSARGRKVAAFEKGWLFGRKEHLGMIRKVVAYLGA
jgi:hypothetical protein